MPIYNSVDFDPPAPVAGVELRTPDSGAILSDVPMLLDTGADVTLIPESAANRLGILFDSEQRYELMSFDGNTSFAPVVRLQLTFCNRVFRGQFLVTDQPWGILGRNILNAMPLLFDGPRLIWEDR